MRVAIVGMQATGLLYGGKLIEAGNEVILIGRRRQYVDVINTEGLRIEEGGNSRVISIPARLAQDVTGKVNMLLVVTRTSETELMLQSIHHLLGQDTWVISLQEGLGHGEVLRRYCQPDRIMLGLTTFHTEQVKPGQIKTSTSGQTLLMPLSKRFTEHTEQIRDLLDTAGLNGILTEDVFPFVWEKLAYHSAVSALAAVSGLKVGRLGTIPEGRQLAFQIASEVLDVAEKKGIEVNRDRVKTMMAEAFVKHYNYKPSMLEDIEAGKKTELEALHGAVIREAMEVNCPVPYLEVFYKLIKVMEQIDRSDI
jgi:2-dehydropantoate 2-reductase